jgi:hypothetical protein
MKNVAATSGQSVSLATAFLVEGNTWERTCAGSDTVLNFFLSSSYKRSSLSFSTKQVHVLKNTRSVYARKKKMQKMEKSLAGKTVLRDGCYGGWCRLDGIRKKAGGGVFRAGARQIAQEYVGAGSPNS